MPPRALPALTLAFAAGIAFAGAEKLPAAALLFPLLAAALLLPAARAQAARLLFATALLLALVLGAFREAVERDRHPDLLAPWLGQSVEVVGRVEGEPQPRPFGWRCRLQAHSLACRGVRHRLDASLFLLTSPRGRLPAGAWVSASGVLRPLQGSANFGEPDAGERAAREHLYASLFARDGHVRILAPAELRPDLRLALALRERLAAVHRALLPPEDAALLNSLILGDQVSPVPEAVADDFRRAGAIHLLVASGTQVTMLACWLILRNRKRLLRLPGGRWTLGALTVATAWLYALMAGSGPSVLRAAIMASFAALAMMLGREADPLSLLAWAALVLLAGEPSALFGIGFQLSFAATWGLIVLEPWFRDGMASPFRWLAARSPLLARILLAATRAQPDQPPRLRGWLWIFSGSLAAQVATAPLIAHTFSQVVWAGLLANLLAVPLAAGLLHGGLLASGVGLLSLPCARFADVLNAEGLHLLRGWIGWCAHLPYGHFWVVPPSAGGVALCFLAFGLLPRLRREQLRAPGGPASLALIGVFFLGLGWRLAQPRPSLRVTFLDVGQGDSILVQTPSGRTLLVDGGGSLLPGFDVGERVLLPAILRRGVRRLDLVLLTHPHADHAGGLEAVCRELPIGAFLDPDIPCESAEAERLLRSVRERGIPRLRARAPAAWPLDAGTRLSVLHPSAAWCAAAPGGNDGSVVLRLDYGRVGLLLPADIGRRAEESLVDAGAPLPCQVLKVGHHGSAGSSGERFLAVAAPRVAVASVGRGNLHGFPSPQAVGRLLAAGALLYRTDEDGAVEVTTDGQEIEVRTARSRASVRWRVGR